VGRAVPSVATMSQPLSPPPAPEGQRFRQLFVIGLVIGISILFLLVIRRFLLTVLLAAVFAGRAN
jgi:hypothetical protein